MAIMEALGQFMQPQIILLFVGFFIFIIIAYKLFKLVAKALIVGLVGAAFPVVVNFLGFNNIFGVEIALSFQNMIFFALVGIVAFIIYYVISGMLKAARFLARPLTGGGTRREIRKELEREKKRQRK